MAKRKRTLKRTTMEWAWIENEINWGKAKMKFCRWDNGVRHEVVLTFDTPWAVAHARHKLREILDKWDADLQAVRK